MKRSSKVFLIGLPGCGKSTLGQLMAEKLGFRFIDLDTMIIETTGNNLTDIFKNEGEKSFRAYEHTALLEVLKAESKMIIATGGGTPCFYDNLEQMKAGGLVIFLHEDMEVIKSRLKNEEHQRPLLASADWESDLAKLYDLRLSQYKKADMEIVGPEIQLHELLEVLEE